LNAHDRYRLLAAKNEGRRKPLIGHANVICNQRLTRLQTAQVVPVDHVKVMSTAPRPGSVSTMFKSIKHRLTGSKSENKSDMSSGASGVVDLGADDPADDKPVKVGASQGASRSSTALTYLRE
jgi:hypothetical protein